ncbi:alpha-glucosidase [Andrena cerasifolii]|uniref:alpha-glucosidase n=1 Tax=Andrena cerasifolii TaxID=2819439 RepID=UPI0040378A31
MFRLTVIACLVFPALSGSIPRLSASTEWHKNALVYQIYPRSFKDSNGDGIGDLNGITSKLEHVADIGVTAFWLSPIYRSPQVDFGYDISNFTDVDPDYGTLEDFDRLVAKAKSLGLKVILDLVPNHSSPEHPWFKKSVQKIKPYDEYYIWRDAKIVNGTRQPPNNWLSTFTGPAWQWNEDRKQYYLHQFAAGQPDLNYRSEALNQEMKDVLTFWLKRGVDGFRIDAINYMFEVVSLMDEPSANRTDIPADDYDSLVHIYTRDQNETYDVLKSWRKLMDDYSDQSKTDAKMILTEAYTTDDLVNKFYKYGSTVPFNFMFIIDLNIASTAAEFKKHVDQWVSSVSGSEYLPNWVVGNHDNHRVRARYGAKRADQISMLSMMLPGITVVYNGDEIGMQDRNFSYQETLDPAGCNAGPQRYFLKSRDPERTPFQWDKTISAGFSSTHLTWLPVHSNYKAVNLETQKLAATSHYKVFKALSALKKSAVVAQGSLQVTLVNNKVLGVVRKLGSTVAVLLINFSNSPVTANAKSTLDIPANLVIYTASIGSNLNSGMEVDTTSIRLPGAASVIYTSPSLLSQRAD